MATTFNFQPNNNINVNFMNIFKDVPIQTHVKQHLVRVYTTLAFTLLAASFGAVFDMYYHIGGILTSIATFGVLMYLASTQAHIGSSQRFSAILLFGFLKGVSLGRLIEYAIHIDSSIIVTALLGTTAVFVCFSLSAMYANRQTLFATGAMLSSGVTFLLLLSLVRLFVRSPFLFSVELYLGLVIFAAYVLFDTQKIIMQVENGDKNYEWHAIELFIDFVAIFVRILIILTRKAEEKEKKKRNNRD